LYFASLRFVIASSTGLSFEETRPPVRREVPGADRPNPEACRDGPRVAKRIAGRNRPASRRFLGRNRRDVKQKGAGFAGQFDLPWSFQGDAKHRTRNLKIPDLVVPSIPE
jgi:hypothetical protein